MSTFLSNFVASQTSHAGSERMDMKRRIESLYTFVGASAKKCVPPYSTPGRSPPPIPLPFPLGLSPPAYPPLARFALLTSRPLFHLPTPSHTL